MEKLANKDLIAAFVSTYSLDRHFSTQLIESMRLTKLTPGEYLITQGSRLTKLHLVVEGKLQVEHYEKDGSRAVFSIEKAFSVIGDLELFHHKVAETVSTVKALSDTYILELPVSKVEQFGLSDPAFLRFICQQLSNKLYNSSQFHSNAAFKAEYKVRKYLAYRAESEGPTIRLEKRESIAAMLGVSVRQLNRSLKSLAEQELIDYKNKTVHVTDVEQLADVSPTEFE
ncbi:Crp/Fnr family transcriptional regulator [Vibrio natriegens]|uniref:Crp/Fnr family transcriptional regulator n=1 Tax=Vibrio natriegens TaxID=691 RepID=UPI000804688E|nr:Crp/Fnr family transcriptional regulator [Vibrio natriegens]ANQ25721.1 Crp/Fnr family transcriptional regulator [Vibrio natriegens]